jgi:Galactose oxidase, central domain
MVSVVAVAVLVGCTSNEPEAVETTGATTQTADSPLPGPAPSGLSDAGGRAAHTATSLLDGRVLIAGGCVTDGCSIATDQTVVVAEDARSSVAGPTMAAARTNHTASLLPDGRVVLAGGFVGEGAGVTDEVDMFDPRANSITAMSPLRQPRGGHAGVRLRDGRVLIAGGWIAPQSYTATVELIDPATGEVSAGEALPWAADALEAALLADGRVLVMGGQVAPGTGTTDAAVFDPVSGHWSEVGPMATPRLKHFAVTLPDGRVLVMGGTPDDETLLASTEIFDPSTGRFTPGPTMREPRYKLAGGAVVLDDGRVLIVGGGQSVEVLDVAAGTSQMIEELGGRASFATVNLLQNGQALLVGGYDDSITLVGLARTITIPS